MGIFDEDDDSIQESERKFTHILNALLKGNIPMEEWCSVFKTSMDRNNEVEDYNFSMLKYFPSIKP